MHSIHVLPSARKDLNRLKGKIFGQIKERILSLGEHPRPPQCIKMTADQGYRLRNGDYRILYRIDDERKRINIYRVKHRREVYRF